MPMSEEKEFLICIKHEYKKKKSEIDGDWRREDILIQGVQYQTYGFVSFPINYTKLYFGDITLFLCKYPAKVLHECRFLNTTKIYFEFSH